MTLVDEHELTTRRMVEVMRRIYILFIMCSLAISSMAQTQQGYVKTLGRQNKKGVALGGVTVRVKGAHNAMQSKNDGTFSMQIKGESYALQQVQKTGYELNDAGIIGRKYAYSSNVPLTVVMVSTAQLQADKQRIENNAFQTAEKNYKAKMAQLEKQKANNTITIEQYRQQIQDLQDKFEKYQSLIDGLADHYAHVDYDDLNEKEREINLCIEKGELERADQLLQQLGVKQRIADIERRFAAGQRLMDEAKADMAAVMKQQEKDAEHLYQLYTIALAKFDNKKARSYIETRAELDTTNVRWQIDTGEFLLENLNDFKTSMRYFECALRHSESGSMDLAECLNDMGTANLMKGQFSKAYSLCNQSLEIRMNLFGKMHPSLATVYNNLAVCMEYQHNLESSLSYHQQSLNIRKELYDENSAKMALAYHNIAAALIRQKKYEQAFDYLLKAKTIVDALKGVEQDRLMPDIYDAIASVYVGKADQDGMPIPQVAFDIGKHVLALRLAMYGEDHIKTAGSFHNMGVRYAGNLSNYILSSDTVSIVKTSELLNCFTYLSKSLEIRRHFLDDNHQEVRVDLENMSLVGKLCYILAIRNMGRNNTISMIEYFLYCDEFLSKEMRKEDYPIIIKCKMALGDLSHASESYSDALDYYEKALNYCNEVNDKENRSVLLESMDSSYQTWIKKEPYNSALKARYSKYKSQYKR